MHFTKCAVSLKFNLNIKIMKNRYILPGVLLILLTAFLSSCYYDEVLPPEVGEVSFNEDIIPIFNQACNMSGCHNGTIAPDLRPANAYTALNSGGYLNRTTPVNSELYLWMRGDGGRSPMPNPTNAVYNSTVLAWIEQGADNN